MYNEDNLDTSSIRANKICYLKKSLGLKNPTGNTGGIKHFNFRNEIYGPILKKFILNKIKYLLGVIENTLLIYNLNRNIY